MEMNDSQQKMKIKKRDVVIQRGREGDTEGLIKINLMGDDSSALPLKVNPLSGVQKVAIYW